MSKTPSRPPRAAKKTAKRPRHTSIVPRVVFQTVVAASVVPAAGASLAGCYCGSGVAVPHDARFSVADVGFSVAADGGFSVALPVDAGMDANFSVADVGFSVAVPLDAAADGGPADDAAFSVAVEPTDAG